MIRAGPLTTRVAISDLVDWLLTVLIAHLSVALLFTAASPVPDKAVSVAVCLAMIGAGLLRRCARPPSHPTGFREGMMWSLSVAAGACVLIVVNAAAISDPGYVLGMGAGTWVLAATIAALHLRLRSRHHRDVGGYYLIAVVVLVTAAPLWLGPCSEWFVVGEAAINAVVAVSPISYLAVMADYDYLRSDWFYQHTPLGMLRYDYLSKTAYTGCWLLLAVAALAAPRIGAWTRQAVRPGVSNKQGAKATGDPAS